MYTHIGVPLTLQPQGRKYPSQSLLLLLGGNLPLNMLSPLADVSVLSNLDSQPTLNRALGNSDFDSVCNDRHEGGNGNPSADAVYSEFVQSHLALVDAMAFLQRAKAFLIDDPDQYMRMLSVLHELASADEEQVGRAMKVIMQIVAEEPSLQLMLKKCETPSRTKTLPSARHRAGVGVVQKASF